MTCHKFIIILLFMLSSAAAMATEKTDTTYQRIRNEYLTLYNNPEKTERFYKVSQQMMDYYLKQGKKLGYYKVRINEALYDTEHGQTYQAIKKANMTLEDMKNDGIKQYEVVYTVLGTLFESRGNYRMANEYYMKALKSADPQDEGTLISIYSRLASLKGNREPKEAWKWNEQFGALAKQYPEYQQIYLIQKGAISFFLNDKQQFMEAYRQLEENRLKHPETDDNGLSTIKIMKDVFDGNYEEAIKSIQADTLNGDDLNQLDIYIHAYEMMGMGKQALEQVNKRRDLRDSLNNNMIFESINAINAEVGLANLNEKAAKERELWLAAIIVLLMIALALVVWRHLTRHRYRKKLQQQNKELEIALSRAEESDRMKDSFIEHVSHEIRTPLNVITGYAQIITNPHYKLTDEQRNRFINDISKNTTEITYIVNELLEVAQDESREYYQKDDTIAVNEFCKKLLQEAEKSNKQQLNLQLDTALNDDYTLRSNSVVLEKILSQLLNNAIKFTKEGRVELNVHESPDGGILRFIVTDTGIGIAEEHHERIFERFFKVDPFKQGFGLGLTMSRKMATLLGGSLDLDTTYTNGARFILTLPVNAESLA